MTPLAQPRVKIIAEIGSNHDGKLDTARDLVSVAADCGADVCKFQSFLVDDLLAHDDTRYERLKKLEMPQNWYPVLIEHCRREGVAFLSTATNHTTLDWMEKYGAWGYKVASCNLTHRPLIDRLTTLNKPLMVSTGMASLEEILALARYFDGRGFAAYSFLHCVSKYPTPPAELRLRNIVVLKEILNCPVGFSDHSSGPHLAVAAVALGATIVEKHISLTKTGLGMDHQVALLPEDFRTMCRAIRDAEAALRADFTPDWEMIKAMRRSLHFTRDMRLGETIDAADVKVVRPEDGLPPAALETVIGRRLDRDVKADAPVTAEAIAPDPTVPGRGRSEPSCE
ncbi:MAG: N-acetylneuraminate synthase family protein [Proteobacteria bacterium]|nr:N-acetylneuraminate synthase family protein [Pseudomonadota bacterium]